MKKNLFRTVFAAFLFICSGCFPMEIAVSKNGDIVIPRAEGFVVYNCVSKTGYVIKNNQADEAPSFAALSADGSILARAIQFRGQEGTLTSLSKILVGPVNGSEAKEVDSVDNACFIQISPDNKTVSYSVVLNQGAEGLDEAMPELHIYSIESGLNNRVSRNVSVIHRWTSDGKIIFLKTDSKKDQTRFGRLCSYDPATNKISNIVSVTGAEWFDLASGGEEAVLSAKAVSTNAKDLSNLAEDVEKKLFVINLKTMEIRALEYDADFCRYSPNGNKIALLRKNQVEVTDRSWPEPTKVLVSMAAAELENSTKVHLSWLNNSELLVLRKKAIYGVNGVSLELVVCNVENGEIKSLQREIEKIAEKIE